MTGFERLIISRMDDIIKQQRRNHEYCVTQFQQLNDIVEEQRRHHEFCAQQFQQLHQQVDDVLDTLNNFNG